MDDKRVEHLRVPPASVEAEQAVIGGLLLDADAFARIDGQLSEADFYRRDHQLIFRAIRELADGGHPCDVITVGEWFATQGLSEQVDGGAYLTDLAASTPGAANIKAYAQIVQEKARQRRLIDIGTGIVNAGFNPEGRSAEEITGDALRQLDGSQAPAGADYGLCSVDLADFMATSPNTIGWAIRPIVPRGEVTLWGGHGGAGKSISVLQLIAHGACGEPWQGMSPDDYLRCLYVSLEDSGDKVRYRLRRICESYNLHTGRVEEGVRVVDCPSGRASLMVEESKFGIRSMTETALMSQLRRYCEGADVIVIDNASDAFGGNENDRQAVRAFMSALKRIARDYNAGVILLAHIDKASAKMGAAGNTYSGSTAWHNSARSRIAIVTEQGAEGAPATVRLLHEKNQYGKLADPVSLKWNDAGVLMPLTHSDRTARVVDYTEQAFAVICAAARLGIRVSPETIGQNPGHKAVQHLQEYAPFLAHKRKQVQFHAELQALEDAGRIVKHPVMTGSRKALPGWIPAGFTRAERAPNSAPNAAPNASNGGSPPPYKTPYGGFYMGGDADSAHHSAQRGGHSAQSDDGEAFP